MQREASVQTCFSSKQQHLSWFATTWQGGHVGGQNNIIFSRRINLKIEFSFLRREMLLFLTTNTAALTSWSLSGHGVQTSNTVNRLLRPPLAPVLSKGCKERHGPTLGVRLVEVPVMRESTVSHTMYHNHIRQCLYLRSNYVCPMTN